MNTQTVKKEENRALDQARSQLSCLTEMVERLEHTQNCTESDCREGENGGDTWTNSEEYHDEESAQQHIQEDPLEVSVRSDWASSTDKWEKAEYLILLCTGGPAVRIIGQLDQDEPSSAVLEYQDWGTPWTECPTSHKEQEIMQKYAQCFYFGE